MPDSFEGLIVMMGVSGCGKSTLGTALAERLNVPFVDGDDLHPEPNKQKMASGVPLNDSDRKPWLQAICDTAEQTLGEQHGSQPASDRSLEQQGRPNAIVVACSALKAAYRDQLRSISSPVAFVHLHAPQTVISERQANRPGHFMPPKLLASQYNTLESPTGEPNVIEVSVEHTIPEILTQLDLRFGAQRE